MFCLYSVVRERENQSVDIFNELNMHHHQLNYPQQAWRQNFGCKMFLVFDT